MAGALALQLAPQLAFGYATLPRDSLEGVFFRELFGSREFSQLGHKAGGGGCPGGRERGRFNQQNHLAAEGWASGNLNPDLGYGSTDELLVDFRQFPREDNPACRSPDELEISERLGDTVG
ncbi:MAG: hypothetical protein WA399_16560, partial [Acidobacteriaceae bacterium]